MVFPARRWQLACRSAFGATVGATRTCCRERRTLKGLIIPCMLHARRAGLTISGMTADNIAAVEKRTERLVSEFEGYVAKVAEVRGKPIPPDEWEAWRSRVFEHWCMYKLAGLQEMSERQNAVLRDLVP